MNEIVCPHCHKTFKIDDAGYADILKQVRDADFEQQLHDRLEIAEREKASAVELATTKVSMDLQREAAGKDAVLVTHPRAGHRVLLPGETTPRSAIVPAFQHAWHIAWLDSCDKNFRRRWTSLRRFARATHDRQRRHD